MQVQASGILRVELSSDGRYVRIVRDGGGLVHIRLDEVRGLVASLSELAARAAAEASGQDYVSPDDLW